MKSKSTFIVGDILAAIWIRRKEVSYVSILGYIVLLVSFLLQVAIARLLGIENYGIYSATLAIVALVEVPLIGRGGEIALKILGEKKSNGEVEDLSSISRSMIRYDFRLYGSTFIALLLFVWLFGHKLGIDPVLFTILALMIPAQTGFGVFKSYFIIFDKLVIMSLYEFIYIVLLASLNLFGIFILGVYGLAISMVAAMLLKNYLAFLFTRQYIPVAKRFVIKSNSESLLNKEGGLSIIRNMFSNGSNQIDIVLLGFIQKPEIVALYKVGKSLASLPIKISFPVWRFLQPKLMHAVQKEDVRKEKRIIVAGSLALIVVMIFLAPLVILFGESVLIFFYGKDYQGAYEYFLILLVGIWVFHGITGWFKFWVVITKSPMLGIGIYAASFISIVLLGLMFADKSSVSMAYIVTSVLIAISTFATVKVFFK